MLEFFFTYPTREVHLRELSRELKLSIPPILTAVKKLEKENLIQIERTKVITKIKANVEDKQFKRLKRVNNLERLYTSGVADFLWKEFDRPDAIVCFGSYSRGEDWENGDIDIAIFRGIPIRSGDSLRITHKKEFEKLENALKRRISIHTIQQYGALATDFQSNINNGIVLEGAL